MFLKPLIKKKCCYMCFWLEEGGLVSPLLVIISSKQTEAYLGSQLWRRAGSFTHESALV